MKNFLLLLIICICSSSYSNAQIQVGLKGWTDGKNHMLGGSIGKTFIRIGIDFTKNEKNSIWECRGGIIQTNNIIKQTRLFVEGRIPTVLLSSNFKKHPSPWEVTIIYGIAANNLTEKVKKNDDLGPWKLIGGTVQDQTRSLQLNLKAGLEGKYKNFLIGGEISGRTVRNIQVPLENETTGEYTFTVYVGFEMDGKNGSKKRKSKQYTKKNKRTFVKKGNTKKGNTKKGNTKKDVQPQNDRNFTK